MSRVLLPLLKHVFDPDLQKKLSGILSLMKTLMEKETGLQYFETVLRYLFSTMDDISTEAIKEIAEQALSGKKEGDYIMTLKFPDQVDPVMAEVRKINDLDMLIKIKDAIKTAKDVSEILLLMKN